MKRTKVNLHRELNIAYAKLLEICLILGLRSYHKSLLRARSFVSNMINYSDIPSV